MKKGKVFDMTMRDPISDDGFYLKRNCDRCHGPFDLARIMSWFTQEVICMECSDKESVIKKKIVKAGQSTTDYEGCGYIPTKF
jgi:hypothetical protein